MKIALGSDHAGFELKQQVSQWLHARGVTVVEVGPQTYNAGDDYPDYAGLAAKAVADGTADLGIIICSTGVGSCIAANKVRGVRAALCQELFCARMSRLHNNANVLCLGANIVGPGLAKEIVETWLESGFSREERHRRRVEKLNRFDAGRE